MAVGDACSWLAAAGEVPGPEDHTGRSVSERLHVERKIEERRRTLANTDRQLQIDEGAREGMCGGERRPTWKGACVLEQNYKSTAFSTERAATTLQAPRRCLSLLRYAAQMASIWGIHNPFRCDF